jgi:hypothetical protein
MVFGGHVNRDCDDVRAALNTFGTVAVFAHWLIRPVILIGITEESMRKIGFVFAALAAFGLALPLAAPAKAEEAGIVIKSGDRDRDHDRRWHRDHHKVTVVVKHRHHQWDHDHD